MEQDASVRIEPQQLDPTTLREVILEFVTRDGTDHSQLEARVTAVRRLLDRGEAELWFDPVSKTCNITPA